LLLERIAQLQVGTLSPQFVRSPSTALRGFEKCKPDATKAHEWSKPAEVTATLLHAEHRSGKKFPTFESGTKHAAQNFPTLLGIPFGIIVLLWLFGIIG
jgi:hypothetical protein